MPQKKKQLSNKTKKKTVFLLVNMEYAGVSKRGVKVKDTSERFCFSINDAVAKGSI